MMEYVNLILSSFPILAALVSFGLGIFVFIRNPRHPANIGFGLGMLSLTLIEGGDAIFLLSTGGARFMIGKRLSLIGEVFLPSTWFLFSITFARANYKEIVSRWRPILAMLGAGSIFFTFWIKSSAFISLPPASGKYDDVLLLGPIGRYFYIFLIFGMIVNLIHLENTLRSSAGSIRQQIKYLIIGVGAIFSFQIYLASKALLFSLLNKSYIPVTSTVVLISCGLLMFTIVHKRLLDVDIFISRYVIYNSVTVLIVGVYLLVVGLVAQGIKLAGGAFDTFWSTLFAFTALLGVAIALLSTRLRRRFQLFINRHFYKHKYEFRDKWMETIEKMGTKGDLPQIQKAIVEMISETMGVREVYLWLYEPAYHKYHLAHSTDNISNHLLIKEDHPLISYIKRHPTPFLIDEIQDKGAFTEEATFPIIEAEVVLCTPLIFGGGEIIGFILQGKDISGEPYRKDDFDLLRAIASHAASHIKNIRLTQEILAAREAEAFHEVSSFFIHDLKNLISTLSLLVQNAEEYIDNPSFQQEAMRVLRTTVSKMNTMLSNLTLLSRGFKINPAPVNLNHLLDEILSTLNGQVSSRIIKRLERLPDIPADAEQLRKVFLNLLLNAIEASPPDKGIEIETLAKNGEVVLSVSDYGCGMSPDFIQTSLFRPFRSTKPKGLGIGLFQCKKIIEAHGGRIEVESEEGKGSIFRVVLPGEGV